MNDREQEERTFILRLWRERPPTEEEAAVWRFALTDAYSGERRAFGDLEGVVAFVRSQMEGVAGKTGNVRNLFAIRDLPENLEGK